MKKFFNKNLILIAVIAFICMAIPYCSHAEGSIVDRSLSFIFTSIGTAAMGICSWALYLSAQIFDYAMALSLNNKALNEGLGIVQVGWKIMRDVANISFIFILLYIGITTILQLNTSVIKSLLAKVIIVALLVNFSLIITQTVIGASNVLANEFYKKMTPPSGESTTALNIEVKGLSAIFVQGLKLQSLNSTQNTNFASQGEEATLRQILIISVFGCIIMIITAFTLLAGGALFLIRSIGLQLLMIVSPLMFIAYILPETKSYFIKWRSKLLGYSFFAPAFLFQLYILVRVIQKRSFGNLLGTTNAGYAKIFLGFGDSPSKDIALIIQFITLIVLMLGILKTANLMGDAASKAVTGWTDKNMKKVGSYFKRVPGRAASAGVGAVGESADAIARSKQMRRLTRIPLVGGIAQRASTEALARARLSNKAKIEATQKSYENYTDKELKNIIPTLSGFKQAAVMSILTNRGKLKPEGSFTSSRIKSVKALMKRYNMNTKSLDALAWQYAATTPEKIEAIKKLKADNTSKLDSSYFTDNNVLKAMSENFTNEHMKDMMKRKNSEIKSFFGNMIKESGAKNTTDLTNWISKHNQKLASWANGASGQNVLKIYGDF